MGPVSSQAMEVEVAFTGVPVSDLATGRDFVERFLGRPPDILVNADEVMWRLTGSAWLYVVVDAGRAGDALVAVSVTDLDATLADLRGRGVTAHSVEEVGETGRKATVLDPDGNSFAIIEVVG